MYRSGRLLALTAILLAACGGNTAATTTTEAAPTTTTTEAQRADIAEYCAIEEPVFEMDPSDPESVKAGFALNEAVALKKLELAPPEIEDELAIQYEDLQKFIDELEKADWDFEQVPEDAFTDIDDTADAVVIAFGVEHCGDLDPRCNPEALEFCTEDQLAEF